MTTVGRRKKRPQPSLLKFCKRHKSQAAKRGIIVAAYSIIIKKTGRRAEGALADETNENDRSGLSSASAIQSASASDCRPCASDAPLFAAPFLIRIYCAVFVADPILPIINKTIYKSVYTILRNPETVPQQQQDLQKGGKSRSYDHPAVSHLLSTEPSYFFLFSLIL